ncbi:MAG TPA: ABC transporter permease [Actinomycetota bacterium]|nr:ABC transporter permease [Actinomycetota bacterium]
MNDVAQLFRQVRYNNKAFWRNPASAFFTFAFPIMFLVIFNGIFGQSQFFVPAIAAFSIITACYTNIAITVVFLREQGVLKRVRGTPISSVSYLVGRIIHSVLMAYLLVAIVSVFGAVFYKVDLPTHTMVPFLVTIAVAGASFCSMGLAMTALVPNEDAAPPIVNALIIPLAFVSDIFVPTDQIPGWLEKVADFFPLKHIAVAMGTAFNPPPGSSGWEPGHLLIVVIWGVAALLLSIKFFRWEPRR